MGDTETIGIIHFTRQKDLEFVRELGQGATGRTVLLRDPTIEMDVVCKKYTPPTEAHREGYFRNFVEEVRLLHLVHHPNVVRVFSHYLYPDTFHGYILMEYVEGSQIDEYLAAHPDQANDVFLQVIAGFRHLELCKILHRDIRPSNLLVASDGTAKIIDLGFGKQVKQSDDFEKSVSLNWWCEVPKEFEQRTYDFRTEVYFVGKLFEQAVREAQVESFQFGETLRSMCSWDPGDRTGSFFDINKDLQSARFPGVDFTENEIGTYRVFSTEIASRLVKIKAQPKYHEDTTQVLKQLEDLFRGCMLEEFVPDATKIISCLLDPPYTYRNDNDFPVWVLKDFIAMLRGCGVEKRKIILSNLHTRLDAVPRYPISDTDFEDDVPF